MNEDEKVNPNEYQQEYEAQLFGCTAFSVIDQVYDAKSAAVDEAVLLTYRTLKKKYENVGSDVIRKGCEGLRDDIMKSLDKMCDKLEVYLLSNILNIPKNILLPEDAVHRDDSLQKIDEGALDETIEILKTQIRNVTHSIANGYREETHLSSLLDKYQSELCMLRDMETCFKDVELPHLDEDIASLKSETTNLIESMDSLEPINSDSGFYDSNEISNDVSNH